MPSGYWYSFTTSLAARCSKPACRAKPRQTPASRDAMTAVSVATASEGGHPIALNLPASKPSGAVFGVRSGSVPHQTTPFSTPKPLPNLSNWGLICRTNPTLILHNTFKPRLIRILQLGSFDKNTLLYRKFPCQPSSHRLPHACLYDPCSRPNLLIFPENAVAYFGRFGSFFKTLGCAVFSKPNCTSTRACSKSGRNWTAHPVTKAGSTSRRSSRASEGCRRAAYLRLRTNRAMRSAAFSMSVMAPQ